MREGTWLSKGELNALYYETVAGELVFATEAQWGYHARAVARLLACHSATLAKRTIRVLELGASNCVFADALLGELRRLATTGGGSRLERVDYLAVELARGSLESAAERCARNGLLVRRGPPRPVSNNPPPRPALVAVVAGEPPLPSSLGLVHAEASQFVRSTGERFDFVICNELLDDMPCRAYYADAADDRFEVVPAARLDGGRWRIRVERRPLPAGMLAELPAASVTARSDEGAALACGLGRLLEPGGMLLVHDYGFTGPFAALELYAPQQRSLPPFVETEFPPGSENGGFPRRFFRIFADERRKVVQVTNDVNFAELVSALDGLGPVTVLAHGNMIPNRGGSLAKGDGVFLSEFGLLAPHDDLPALLARLNARQDELRDRYVSEHLDGRGSAFFDLVFVRE